MFMFTISSTAYSIPLGHETPTLGSPFTRGPFPVEMATLQSTLRQLFQNQSERVVLMKADGLLPFAHVVHVIDMCRSTGAKVFLVTPGL
jgi:biopolymer transport protein ExbD